VNSTSAVGTGTVVLPHGVPGVEIVVGQQGQPPSAPLSTPQLNAVSATVVEELRQDLGQSVDDLLTELTKHKKEADHTRYLLDQMLLEQERQKKLSGFSDVKTPPSLKVKRQRRAELRAKADEWQEQRRNKLKALDEAERLLKEERKKLDSSSSSSRQRNQTGSIATIQQNRVERIDSTSKVRNA